MPNTTTDRYMVDELFKKLGIYREDLSPTEVIDLLETQAFKYLGDYIDPSDKQNESLYNTQNKNIDFGTLKRFNMTDCFKLYYAHLEYMDHMKPIHDYYESIGGKFYNLYYWDVSVPPKKVHLEVVLGKSDVTVLNIIKQSVKALAKTISAAIEASEQAEAIYSGDVYAEIEIIPSESKPFQHTASIENTACLKLAAAMYRIKTSHPNIEFTILPDNTINQTVQCFYTGYLIYELSYKVYADYVQQITSSTFAEDTWNIELVRKSARNILTDQLKLEKGKVVLTSVVPYSKACISQINDYVISVGSSKDNVNELRDIFVQKAIKLFNVDSLFLGKVTDMDDHFLVLTVWYKSGKEKKEVDIPIPWENFISQLDVFVETEDKLSCSDYNYFLKCKQPLDSKKQLSDQTFENNILNTTLLFTEANSLSMRNPGYVVTPQR